MIKLVINKGAIFDYEDIVCKIPMNIGRIRSDLETEIAKSYNGLETLRIPYRDTESGKDLLIFAKKGYRFGIMQTYILQGICEKDDYDPEMELNGVIEEWLEVEIE